MSLRLFDRRPRLAATAVLAIALAGCGEREDGGAKPESAPTPAAAPARTSPPAEIAAIDPRREFLAMAERIESGMNRFVGRGRVERVRGAIESGRVPPAEMPVALATFAQELLRQGENEEALARIDEAIRLAGEGGSPMLHMLRGLVCMRLSEVRNCIERHNAECCIFPLRGGGVHAEREPAQEALRSFETFLARSPAGTDAERAFRIVARWLANVMAMALGTWPDGLAADVRIDPEAFEPEVDAPRFVDVATALGVDALDLCGGAIVQDFDGDGFLDLVSSTSDPSGPMSFHRARGAAGGFESRSAASGIDAQLGGLNCVAGDYDGDGDADILVLRGAWLFDEGRMRNSLLRCEEDGTFTDVTREAGLAATAAPTQTAAWLDFDSDGDLDVYVGNESRRGAGPAGEPGDYPSELWRNEGDGTFTNVAAQAGVTNDRYAKGVAAGDYDGDGDPDLYVSNGEGDGAGINRLYRNEGDGTFTDVAPELGVTGPHGRSFATWFFDYDNDGDLDLFVAGFGAVVSDVALDHLGLPHGALLPALYRNDGAGGFADVARETGLDGAWLPMGANFADVDGDGWLDLYLATGDPSFETLVPNVLLMNDRGERFLDATTASGLGHLQKGHGVAFADLDHDGDLDLYHQLGGFYRADRFQNALFLNQSPPTRRIVVDLVGTTSNRFGFGARIAVTVEGPGGRRTIHRSPGCVSSFGGSPFRMLVGLGDAEAILEVAVRWPAGGGPAQSFADVPLDAAIRIVEGADAWERLPYEPVDHAGAAALSGR